MSIDDKLYGWDAGLLALIRQLEVYMAREAKSQCMADVAMGWDDAIRVARKLIADGRTQKGLVARECARRAEEKEGSDAR